MRLNCIRHHQDSSWGHSIYQRTSWTKCSRKGNKLKIALWSSSCLLIREQKQIEESQLHGMQNVQTHLTWAVVTYLLFVILIITEMAFLEYQDSPRNAPEILVTPLPSCHVKSNVPGRQGLHQEFARNLGNSHQSTRSTRIPPGLHGAVKSSASSYSISDVFGRFQSNIYWCKTIS